MGRTTTVTGGPTTGAEQLDAPPRWLRRPVAARAVRWAAYAVPLLGATAVTVAVAAALPPSSSSSIRVATAGSLILVSVVVFLLVERVSRRLLPLSVLLDLSLAFPDQAPKRVGVALRASGVKRLRELAAEPERPSADAAAELLALVYSLNAHDRRTRGHCERVRAHAAVIAEEMGIGGEDFDKLQWAALLHDIGKLDVPSAILNKAGKPTDEEWSLLSQHPANGVPRIAPLVPWLGEWARATGEHHERWDGDGYPNGLRGTDISLAARIVAVADAFEVMTAVRSYKRPLSTAAARTEMSRCAGAQFDPVVVRALLGASLGRLRRWTAVVPGWIAQIPTAGGAYGSSAGAALATGTVAGILTFGLVVPPPTTDHAAAASNTSSAGAAADGRPSTAGPADATEPTAAAAPARAGRHAGDAESGSGEAPTGPASTAPSGEGDGDGLPSGPTGAAPTTTPSSGTPQVPGGPTIEPPPVTAAPPPTTSPPPAAAPLTLFLGPAGVGDTRSTPVLPLSNVRPTRAGLPNYDTDRDDAAGLLIAKTGNGLGESDPTKRQLWAFAPSAGLSLDGTAALTLGVATKDFDTSKDNQLVVALQDCNGSLGDCRVLARGDQWFRGRSSFHQVSVPLGSIDTTVASGRRLVVRVQFGNDSDDDGWLAYGTGAHSSALTIR